MKSDPNDDVTADNNTGVADAVTSNADPYVDGTPVTPEQAQECAQELFSHAVKELINMNGSIIAWHPKKTPPHEAITLAPQDIASEYLFLKQAIIHEYQEMMARCANGSDLSILQWWVMCSSTTPPQK